MNVNAFLKPFKKLESGQLDSLMEDVLNSIEEDTQLANELGLSRQKMGLSDSKKETVDVSIAKR